MLTKAEASARVAKGAARLDERLPGWERRIDIGILSLGSCFDCIVGQLFKDESAWPFSYGIRALDMGVDGVGAAEYGVADHNGGERAFDYLQDAWVDAIAARVTQPAPMAVAR